MSSAPPKLVAIDHDDYHAEQVGRTEDGHQFFLATPFESASSDSPGREFIALFLFDSSGALVDAQIENLGPRATMDHAKRDALRDRWLQQLGKLSYCRIEVAPFSLERFGISFGLIPRPPEDEDDSWWVELLPGNYMAFSEPFDSGEYDT